MNNNLVTVLWKIRVFIWEGQKERVQNGCKNVYKSTHPILTCHFLMKHNLHQETTSLFL